LVIFSHNNYPIVEEKFMRNKIIFYLNGKKHEVAPDHAGMMLADYLRYEKSLTGTKIVCAEGDCGACSVLRYFPYSRGPDQNFLAINSCITLVANLDGSSLITVDALKDENQLHPSQDAMIKCHASQCGFCTPGFVMALAAVCEEKISKNQTQLTEQEAKNSMTGNLCRCTGYRPIIDAAMSIDLKSTQSLKERFYPQALEAELQKSLQTGVYLSSTPFIYCAPKTISEALDFLTHNPDARIVGATTDLGVVHNKRKITLNKILSLHLIPELYEMKEAGGIISVGARVTMNEFRHFMKKYSPEFVKYLDVFASPQIKNLATVIGNIANASPIGDTPPALLALNASVVINGVKEIKLEDFFISYRKTALLPGEIITELRIPTPAPGADYRIFKNANRKDLDISAVNFAAHVEWKDQSKKIISKITLAAGGISATPMRLRQTEDYLKQNLNLNEAIKVMHSEYTPLSDVRATSAYRRVLMENFMRRFFADCAGIL
jgi:xanthine dehydrogenase small subunit